MKRLLLFLILFQSISDKCHSETKTDTIRTGIYLKSLYDFNSSAFSYDVDLWMWFKYDRDTLKPLSSVEISNAKKYEFTSTSIEYRDSNFWASQNCKATINQDWDLKHYPFDRQKLEVILEESEHDVRKVVLIADNNKFEYNNAIDIKGWKVDSTTIKSGVSHYKSDFGDPTLHGESEYSKVYYTIFLSRDSWALFLKLFTGCYVAFFVSFLVFFIKPSYVDPRFGLSIGGLFAAVGNKYVVDSNMPESISFTLIDKIHDITFIFILATILLSIISLNMSDREKIKEQIRFDKNSAFFVLIAYLALNILLITNACNS